MIIDQHLSFAMQGLWRATWQASVLAVVVLLVQAFLGRRLGGRGRYALWAIVLVRLLLPVLPESRFSIFNLTKTRTVAVKPVPQLPPETSIDAQPKQAVIPIIVIGPDGSAKPQAAETITVSPELSKNSPIPLLPSRVNWLAIVFSAWLAGIVTLSIRIIHICLKLSRTIRRLSPVTDPDLLEMMRKCAENLNLRRLPRVLAGADVQTPAVIGLFRPSLLLPADVLTRCDAREIRLIVLHELAHLKRHDLAGNWLIAAATVLHWFNPIVWLMASRMRSDRELACDELVLASSSGDAKAYGQTLVKLIEILSMRRGPGEMIGIVGILESTHPMQRRVRMIAQFDPKQSRRWILPLFLLAGLGLVALTDAVRGDNPFVAGAAPKPTPAPSSQPAVFDGSQTDVDLRQKLSLRIPEISFDKIPFVDAMRSLRDRSGTNLVVNWRALEAAGIDGATQVSIQLKNTTLRQALDLILKDVGGGTVALGHVIENGAIVVSTDEEIAKNTTTVAYDVRELIQSDTNKPREEWADALTKLIEDFVMPETWKDNGGVAGTIRELNGKLVIQQTPAAHDKIVDLLKLLKAENAQQAAANPGAANPLFFAGMPAPQASAPRTVVSDEEIETANRQALAILKKKVQEVRLDNIGLSDAIEFYRDISGANIFVNYWKLEQAGVDRNAPISLRLREPSLESALSATVAQLPQNQQSLAIVIDRGVITITTQADAPTHMLTKTYDVKDLVNESETAVSALVNVVQALSTAQEGGMWVQPFGAKLIITALPGAHDQVDKLLADLRKNPTTQPMAKQVAPRPGSY